MTRDPRPVTEYALHCAIIDLLALKAHRDLIYYHPANGEDRSAIVGAKLRRMGVLRGVPDICLVLPTGYAAFLEVKSSRGRQSVEQLVFQSRCGGVGAPYAVVRSVNEAEAMLRDWGALRATRRAA